MKNRFVCMFLLATVIYTLFSMDCLAQQDYQKPQLDNPDSWSVILLPDPQNYVKYTRNQPILELMLAWVEEQIDPLNIKMVLCTGDLVEQNDQINPGLDGDLTSEQQWVFVSKAFDRLNGKTPYIIATGNHDYSIDDKGIRTSCFPDFFKVSKNFLNKKMMVQNNRNEKGTQTIENSAYEIKSLNGKDYLFLTLEFAPRDSILTWAKNITDMEQYKKHRIILLTHAYLNNKDQRTSGEVKWFRYLPYFINGEVCKSERILLPASNNGEQIWNKLVHPANNIELVLCGHISGEGYRIDTNHLKKPVHQMLFDAQSMGGGHRNGNGGDGWLRILEFYPDNKTVKVKTYSPFFGISPTTYEHAWNKDAKNEFTFQFGESEK
ncbi:MAG: metallophosphoesterase [Massilibacteroides sp.]|nr:metallophosphoesterase [Massilibacteroides sp.]MDD4660464.1 metallophosphoesterase [Massilibacteroides sp.]